MQVEYASCLTPIYILSLNVLIELCHLMAIFCDFHEIDSSWTKKSKKQK